jgi:hypothetical protein
MLSTFSISKGDQVEKPQVDHIVEDQIVGHAAARVLLNQLMDPFLNGLKSALNPDTLENYNVTSGSVNASKGSIIKNYLSDGRNRGYPLRSLVKPESHFGKAIEPIFRAMNVTCPVVVEYVREGRRTDGHITGSNTFGSIADTVDEIFREMQLD